MDIREIGLLNKNKSYFNINKAHFNENKSYFNKNNAYLYKLFLILFILLANFPTYLYAKVATKYPVQVFDASGDPTLPRNFRTSNTPFPNDIENAPSRKGLDTLNASGSGQFTGSNLARMLKEINQNNGIIIDLRKESHGFLDNTPISWYGIHNLDNKDRSNESVKISEQRLLDVLGTMRKGVVYSKIKDNDELNFNSRNISFREAKTEQRKVLENTDFEYARLYVLDHYPPDNATIDAFIDITKKMKPGTWVHFHCLAGQGRTTTFLAMYDMLKNAKDVSLQDILKRQALIGGQDLTNVSSGEDWQIPMNQKKLALLENFYLYAKDEKEGYPKRSYSDWVKYKEKGEKSWFSKLPW